MPVLDPLGFPYSRFVAPEEVSNRMQFSVGEYTQFCEWLRRMSETMPRVHGNRYPFELAMTLGKFIKSGAWVEQVPPASRS
jgi:hypothetical protein